MSTFDLPGLNLLQRVHNLEARLYRYEIRDRLASVRLRQYGPMFVKMFDPGRDYRVIGGMGENTSVTATGLYDIVVRNDVNRPCIEFQAGKNGQYEQGSRPEDLSINLLYGVWGDAYDIGESNFVRIEEWFQHTISGKPVIRTRHQARYRELLRLLPPKTSNEDNKAKNDTGGVDY